MKAATQRKNVPPSHPQSSLAMKRKKVRKVAGFHLTPHQLVEAVPEKSFHVHHKRPLNRNHILRLRRINLQTNQKSKPRKNAAVQENDATVTRVKTRGVKRVTRLRERHQSEQGA